MTLILTANIDAGRAGLVHRRPMRRPTAGLRAVSPAAPTPGWAGWLVIAMAGVEATAIARLGGARGSGVGAIAQLVPTVALVLARGAAPRPGHRRLGPDAGDSASGVAAAIQLARALAPRRRATPGVELVLQGAGDGAGHRAAPATSAATAPAHRPRTVVLGLAAVAAGTPATGQRRAARPGPLLRRAAPAAARRPPRCRSPGAGPHRSRGTSPALPARPRRLPAISVGARTEDGLAPRSHTADDTPERVDDARRSDAVVAVRTAAGRRDRR